MVYDMWRSTPMAGEHRRESQEIVLNISPDGNLNSSAVCISPDGYLWVRWLVTTLWIVNINSLFPYRQIYKQVGYKSTQHTFPFSLTLLISLSPFLVFICAPSINLLLITITWRAQPEKIVKDDFASSVVHELSRLEPSRLINNTILKGSVSPISPNLE